MATNTQVKTDAAKMLGIVGDGQTLRSDHDADLTQALAEVNAELQHRDYATWGDAGPVPDQFAFAVAALVADRRRVQYMVPESRHILISENARMGWKTLRALNEVQKQRPTKIENF